MSQNCSLRCRLRNSLKQQAANRVNQQVTQNVRIESHAPAASACQAVANAGTRSGWGVQAVRTVARDLAVALCDEIYDRFLDRLPATYTIYRVIKSLRVGDKGTLKTFQNTSEVSL